MAAPVSPADIEQLMNTLEVDFVALAQCSVSPGYRLELGGVPAPGIHYNLQGRGRLLIGNAPPISLQPHTLIVVPANCPFRIEVSDDVQTPLKVLSPTAPTSISEGVPRFVAGDTAPEVILFCGYFNASYGATVALLENLATPIVEQFAEADHLDEKLAIALRELVAQELGAKAMSAALLKQVIVALLRRSFRSASLWMERFALLSDPLIVRALAQMVAHPAAPHTVLSLAETACLSRSAFMARFTKAVGRPVMSVLRDMRLRQAAQQLKTGHLSLDQVAQLAGYETRNSFSKAFKKLYQVEPSGYCTPG